MSGMVHLYTGAGKGKTTAALGLALRALGAGMRVFIGQFMKAGEFGECIALRRFGDQVEMHQYGSGAFLTGAPTSEDIERAVRGYAACTTALASDHYGVVILDEVVTAISAGLLDEQCVIELIANRPPATELVLTGRGASRTLIDHADLVTEMRDVKHYYDRGIEARSGIEY